MIVTIDMEIPLDCPLIVRVQSMCKIALDFFKIGKIP